MNLIFLKHLLPKGVRKRLRDQWCKLLRTEQIQREKSLYRKFVRPGDLVFDVGANEGVKTKALLSLRASVIAVEPNPACVEAIKFGNHRAVEEGRLTIHQIALGQASGGLTDFRLFDGHSDITSASQKFIDYAKSKGLNPSATFAAPTETLEALIARHGKPVFIKIDVEGMDSEVLKGLESKPDIISVEYHMEAPLKIETEKCIQELARLGFKKANFTYRAAPKLILSKFCELNQILDQISRCSGLGEKWGDIIAK